MFILHNQAGFLLGGFFICGGEVIRNRTYPHPQGDYVTPIFCGALPNIRTPTQIENTYTPNTLPTICLDNPESM